MLNSMGEKELIIIEGAAENKFQKLLTLTFRHTVE